MLRFLCKFPSRQHGRYLRKARTCRVTDQSQASPCSFLRCGVFPEGRSASRSRSLYAKRSDCRAWPLMDSGMLVEFGIVGLASCNLNKFRHLQGLHVTLNVISSLLLVMCPRQVVPLTTTDWYQVSEALATACRNVSVYIHCSVDLRIVWAYVHCAVDVCTNKSTGSDGGQIVINLLSRRLLSIQSLKLTHSNSSITSFT